MRTLLLGAVVGVAALATGCVSASTVDVPHEVRALTSEKLTGLAAGGAWVDDGVLVLRLQRVVDRTYDRTTTIDRQVRYAHFSLAAAALDAPGSKAGRAAMVPVALIGGAVDVVLWVLTAPVAYPAGGIMGLDPAPVDDTVTETEPYTLDAGTPVRVTVGEGDAARTITAPAGDGGRVRVAIDDDAEPALAAGRATLRVQFALPSDPGVVLRHELGLETLVALVESRVRGDLEERHFRWRRIHDAVPAGAPGAAAVKAALQAKIAPLAKALR